MLTIFTLHFGFIKTCGSQHSSVFVSIGEAISAQFCCIPLGWRSVAIGNYLKLAMETSVINISCHWYINYLHATYSMNKLLDLLKVNIFSSWKCIQNSRSYTESCIFNNGTLQRNIFCKLLDMDIPYLSLITISYTISTKGVINT